METDVVVRRVSDGLQQTLRRLSSLAGGVATVASVVGIATFATGMWVFKGTGRPMWIAIVGVLCLIPVAAALVAMMLIRVTAKHSSELLANVRSFINGSSQSAKVLIDHDTGQPVAAHAKNFAVLRSELNQRRKELPALFVGIRAITTVPGLAAVAVLGTVGIGALGTVLLIGGLL